MISSKGHHDPWPEDEAASLNPKDWPKAFPVLENPLGKITLTSVSIGKDSFKESFSTDKFKDTYKPLKIEWDAKT